MSDLISGIFSTMGSGPKVYTGVRGFQRLSSKSQDNSPDDNNKPKENRITRKKIKEKKVNLKNIFEELFDLPDESILVYDAEKQAKLEEEQKKKEIEEKEKNDIIAKRQKEINQMTTQTGDELPVMVPTTVTPGNIFTNEDGTMTTPDGTEVRLDEKGNYVSPSGEIVDVSKIPNQRSMSKPENKFTFSEEITTEQRNLVESCVSQLQSVLANPEVSSSIITTDDDDEDGDPNAVKIIEKTIDDKGESQTSQNIFIDPAVPDFK